MRLNLPPVRVVAAMLFGIAIASARGAGASPCVTDADCPLGFQCTGAAEDGGQTCTPEGCQSNSDCAAGFACFLNIQCVPGPDASLIPGNACVPQWQAPCAVDSDCGNGFQCVVASEACDCSGTDTDVPADAGAVSVPCASAQPPQPPCTNANQAECPSSPSLCEAGSTCLCWGIAGACQQNQMPACKTASDCLPNWSCLCPPDGNGVVTATCSTMSCTPPNSDLAFQGAFAIGGTLGCSGEFPGGSVPAGGGSGVENPGPTPAMSGQAVNGTGSGSVSSPAAAPPSSSSGGCAIGMPRPTGACSPTLAVLGLASAAGGLRRMRRRPTRKVTR